MKSITGLLCVSFLAAHAAGQSCFYSHTADPAGISALFMPCSPTSNFASRYSQCVVTRFRFQNAPVRITSLAFSFVQDGMLAIERVEIRMGHTQRDTLGDNFASNRGDVPVIVLDSHDVAWPHRQGEWTSIDLQIPFVYTPAAGNLLIEFDMTGAVQTTNPSPVAVRHFQSSESGFGPTSVEMEYQANRPFSGLTHVQGPRLRLCDDLANMHWFGTSCAGSGGTRPGLGFRGSSRLGEMASIVLSNAVPSSFALLAFGFDNRSPYPVNLTATGFTGCWQYFTVATSNGLTTDAAGVASYGLAIPNLQELAGLVVYTQFLVFDPAANPGGAATTNYGRIQAGYGG